MRRSLAVGRAGASTYRPGRGREQFSIALERMVLVLRSARILAALETDLDPGREAA
jgi:hypothetical protein